MDIISFVWEAYSNLTYNLPTAIYSFLLRANLLLLCPIIAAFLAFRQGVRNQKIQTALIAVGILIAISLPLNRFMTPTMWRPWLVLFLVLGLWYLPIVFSWLAVPRLDIQAKILRVTRCTLLVLLLLNLMFWR